MPGDLSCWRASNGECLQCVLSFFISDFCIMQIANREGSVSHLSYAASIFSFFPLKVWCPMWKLSNSVVRENKAEELIQTNKVHLHSSLTCRTSQKLGGWQNRWRCCQQISLNISTLAESQGQLYTWMNWSWAISLTSQTQIGFPPIPEKPVPHVYFD